MLTAIPALMITTIAFLLAFILNVSLATRTNDRLFREFSVAVATFYLIVAILLLIPISFYIFGTNISILVAVAGGVVGGVGFWKYIRTAILEWKRYLKFKKTLKTTQK